jgi:hypothetical protein
MVLDLVAVITHCYWGWKIVLEIASSKQSYFLIHFFFYTSQIINFLSYPPDEINVISLEI